MCQHLRTRLAGDRHLQAGIIQPNQADARFVCCSESPTLALVTQSSRRYKRWLPQPGVAFQG